MGRVRWGGEGVRGRDREKRKGGEGGGGQEGRKRKKEEWNVGRKETEHGEGENIEKRGGKKGTRVGSVGRDDQKRDRAPRLEGIGEKKICHYSHVMNTKTAA